jgi:hypothetical protein
VKEFISVTEQSIALADFHKDTPRNAANSKSIAAPKILSPKKITLKGTSIKNYYY